MISRMSYMFHIFTPYIFANTRNLKFVKNLIECKFTSKGNYRGAKQSDALQ